MLFKLFLIFTVIPVVELALLIKIGTVIGTLNTVLLVIITALVGAFLVKLEGLNVVVRFQRALHQGIFPAREIFDGAMILVAGALLVTPGVLTDIAGFLMVFPPTRRLLQKLIRRYAEKRFITIRLP